jgi:hypothetical protein
MMARTKTTATATTPKRGRKPAAPAATPAPAPAPVLTDAERAIMDKHNIEIKPGSLRYDEVMKKKMVVMFCRYCQKPRQIATQDAFQVKTCGDTACKKAHKKANK